MARVNLDFGAANGGLTPPAFVWFRDAQTHAAIPPPLVYANPNGWTYFFDWLWPATSSPFTTEVEYGLLLNGVNLVGTIVQPGFQPVRRFMNFGVLSGNVSGLSFGFYQDALTKIPITKPTIYPNAAPAWNYYFDVVWPSTTTQIEYGINAFGTDVTALLTAPTVTAGQGGSSTLSTLLNRIQFETDTQNDPNISQADLTDVLNQSLFRLYDKLITCFGEDYFSAQAQFTTDGVSNSFALPDGILYGGAPPFYKGELLETIGGAAGASPQAPLTLHKFNMREKNRYSYPLTILAVPNMLPRYRIVGSSIVFSPIPSGGLVCNLWYAPKLSPLVNLYDVANDFSGWLEFAVVDAAIKVLDRQSRDVGTLAGRWQTLSDAIDRAAPNRDLAEPNTVAITEDGFGPFGIGGMGMGGNFF